MALSYRQKVNGGFFLALFLLAVVSVLSYRNATLLTENSLWVAHTHEVVETIETALSQVKDLETGQRGFLITGQESYLAPFNKALGTIDQTLQKLQALTSDAPAQQQRVEKLKALKDEKVAELNQTIKLRREMGFKASLDVVMNDTGKRVMDDFRSLSEEMKNSEMSLLSVRNEAASQSTHLTLLVIFIGGVFAFVFFSVAIVVINLSEVARATAAQKLEDQSLVRAGLIKLNEKILGEQPLSSLASNIIESLSTFVGAQVGTLYLAGDGGDLRWAGGYGFTQGPGVPSELIWAKRFNYDQTM